LLIIISGNILGEIKMVAIVIANGCRGDQMVALIMVQSLPRPGDQPVAPTIPINF
jgi:hypothetical protein